MSKRVERYELERSPLAQKPTQRDLAALVHLSRDQLRQLASDRETWIVRRDEDINGKQRHLAYPRGALRRIHELLKFHCKKIKQPDYLFSPRTGRSQRDNAAQHLGQKQFLKLDIKQFYPSTTEKHIFRWLKDTLGMSDDVAGLFVRLVTVDGTASFGSPLTPVLTTLVHRGMFDSINASCKKRGLKMSLWVDDIAISGKFVPGKLVREIRAIVRSHGLKSHKLQYRDSNRPVSLTGIEILGERLSVPRSLHEKIQSQYRTLLNGTDDIAVEVAINKLLSLLGTSRYTAGRSSPAGQSASDQMNMLRQRRSKLNPTVITTRTSTTPLQQDNSLDAPWL